ncbi:E3 SUMO-protein ligase ZBED1-like [Dreissena polymorpha]|uniref:E3 SUMO-protein ligase ZBED1-like n=1 Tax=Dreissena polymorpha TaxID=45954 RepID=UPI00226567C5|nr:E3 SUMO-protein ligase ZBED1-like [Dreissena polymorpha]
MTSFVLQTREISVSHTAENLSEVLNCAIKGWGLIKDGLKPNITTNNAANIVNAVCKSILVHVRCMAHTLNLATQKGMKVEGISEILRKIRRIVGFFHRSSTAAALLKSNQIGLNIPVPKHKLIQVVETRWNSSFDMLKRILEQKHVLSPFKTATEALSGERYPTVSLIFSMKMTLLTHFKPALSDSDMVKQMKEVMHADLSTRYNGQETEQFLLEASILDPRFKLVPHASEEQKAKAYGSFRDQMLSILQTKTEVI